VAERIPARLTVAQGQRFGLTVGGAFLGLAAIVWWRGVVNAAIALTILGLTLVVAGLIVPTHLGGVERAWMALAHRISMVTTPVVMGAMYLLVITPIGILRRWFGGDPLKHSQGERGFWKPRPANRRSSNLRRQF
jgi:hypothetical protein